MSDDLHVHLQNHWTAATGGVDFARRVARSHEGSAVGVALAEVADDVADDRESLRTIMEQVGVRPAAAGASRGPASWSGWEGSSPTVTSFAGHRSPTCSSSRRCAAR